MGFYNILMIVLLMAACGADPNSTATTSATGDGKKPATPTADKSETASQLTDNLTVTGYISPIYIEVNGDEYANTEDWYTQEINTLRDQAAAKYPQYNLSFDAQAGAEFSYGFTAFIAPVAETGYAGSASVTRGKFSFTLPSNIDRQAAYLVSVSKRLELKLYKGADTITWCYNLTGDSQISLDGQPILIRSFTTKTTEYRCEKSRKAGSGMTIPDPPLSKIADENQL